VPDLREVTITIERRLIVDVERFFTEYPDEWQEFEDDGMTREDFIRETINEIGTDDLDFFTVNHPTKGWSAEEETMDVEIRKL